MEGTPQTMVKNSGYTLHLNPPMDINHIAFWFYTSGEYFAGMLYRERTYLKTHF